MAERPQYPLVERIAQAIAAEVASISTAGGAYAWTAEVHRPVKTAANWVPKQHGVYILADKRTQEGIKPGNPARVDWWQEFTLGLIGCQAEKTAAGAVNTTPVDQVLAVMEADVVRVVMADQTHGGLARDTKIGEPVFFRRADNVDVLEMNVAVLYRVMENDPYIQG